MKKIEFDSKDFALARNLKALSHPVRISIIKTLLNNCNCPKGNNPCSCGEKCEGKNCKCGCKCGTIVDMFDMSQSTISQHIKELKSAGLIELKSRKGTYTLNHSKLQETLELLRNIIEIPIINHIASKCNCDC